MEVGCGRWGLKAGHSEWDRVRLLKRLLALPAGSLVEHWTLARSSPILGR